MIILASETIPDQSVDWLHLFHLPTFYNLHKTNTSVFLTFLLEEKTIGIAQFDCASNDVFQSPIRGSFGGLQFIEGTSLSLKNECIVALDQFIVEKKIKQSIIISAPFAYGEHEASSVFNCYLNNGYEILNHDVNHSLIVDEVPMFDKMKRNNKKRLKKCNRDGFTFNQVSESNDYKDVYDVIAKNRKSKGYFISMSFDQVMEMAELFPDRVFFFNNKCNDEIVSASICMKISDSVLYVVYWGDLPGNEKYSPISHLANGIYEFAHQNSYNLIDAGTSSIDGQPNYGVATFKENLGFTSSLKLTYSKNHE